MPIRTKIDLIIIDDKYFHHEKNKWKKISPQARDEIRKRAIQRVRDGESSEVVVKAVGFSRHCIYNWLVKYGSGGWDALKTGKEPDRPDILDDTKIRWIFNLNTMGDS